MKESGYYPEGTEFSSDAPWNQKEELGLYRVVIALEVEAYSAEQAADGAQQTADGLPYMDAKDYEVEEVTLIELVDQDVGDPRY